MPGSAERISLSGGIIQANWVFTSETDRDVKTSRGDLSLMPRGASRALEEARRARANEVLRVIHGNPGQIIRQKRNGEEWRLSGSSFASVSCYARFQRALQRGRTLRPNRPAKRATNSASKSQILSLIFRFKMHPSLWSIGAERNLLKRRGKLNSRRTKTGLQNFQM